MTRPARFVRLLLAAALLAFVPALVVPRPVVACFCAGQQPLTTYARDGSPILVGTVVERDQRGYRVHVEHWFAGGGPLETHAWITGDFGDGSSCGTSEPAVGTRWLWVAWRQPPDTDLQISICAPAAELDTPEGQALLAEAQATLGGPAIGGGSGLDLVVVLAAGGALLAGVLVIGGAVLLARRGTPGVRNG